MKVAIFDMDGTLIDSLFLWDVIWEAFAKRFKYGELFLPTQKDREDVKTCPLHVALSIIHEHYDMGERVEELVEIAHAIIRDFYGNKVELKPGVKEYLEYCKNQGVSVCVASATELELIDIALSHCGIKDYFEKIFTCASIGKGKEHPDVFLAACQYFGADVKDVVVFEDALLAIRTAKKVGFTTVGIYEKVHTNWEEVKAEATYVVDKGETMIKMAGIKL